MNDNKHVSRYTHTHTHTISRVQEVRMYIYAPRNPIFIARAKGRCAKKEPVRIRLWLRDKCTCNGLRKADRDETQAGGLRYAVIIEILSSEQLTQLTGARNG